MPCAASSSAVPIIAVQSPSCTRRSRPGQATTSPELGELAPRITATGARSPYISRNVASRGASVPETTNSMPATVIGWVVRPRQASTTNGAARSATSRMAPGPLLSAIASRSTVLASRATTRTVGLSCLAKSAIWRLRSSSSSAQITAFASATPAAANPSAVATTTTSVPALFSSSMMRNPERVVSADDGVALHAAERYFGKRRREG